VAAAVVVTLVPWQASAVPVAVVPVQSIRQLQRQEP